MDNVFIGLEIMLGLIGAGIFFDLMVNDGNGIKGIIRAFKD